MSGQIQPMGLGQNTKGMQPHRAVFDAPKNHALARRTDRDRVSAITAVIVMAQTRDFSFGSHPHILTQIALQRRKSRDMACHVRAVITAATSWFCGGCYALDMAGHVPTFERESEIFARGGGFDVERPALDIARPTSDVARPTSDVARPISEVERPALGVEPAVSHIARAGLEVERVGAGDRALQMGYNAGSSGVAPPNFPTGNRRHNYVRR